jgi:DNA-binding transcriptional LysR family regulator
VIEIAVGSRLFERSRNGYHATAVGEEMIGLASRMNDSIVDFERRIAGRDFKPAGELKVTTVDALAANILPQIIARFLEINPAVQIELVLAQQYLSLSRRDADIAIRATSKPPESLVGRRICKIRWAVYAAPALVKQYGDELLARAPWLTDAAIPANARRWLEANIASKRQVLRVNSALCLAAAAAAGTGAVLLPCFLGSGTEGITRLGPPIAELETDLWILTHADLRHSARVRAFMEFGSNELAKLRPLLEGGPDSELTETALEPAP